MHSFFSRDGNHLDCKATEQRSDGEVTCGFDVNFISVNSSRQKRTRRGVRNVRADRDVDRRKFARRHDLLKIHVTLSRLQLTSEPVTAPTVD